MNQYKSQNLVQAFELLISIPDDFMANGREQDLPQEREHLDGMQAFDYDCLCYFAKALLDDNTAKNLYDNIPLKD